MRLQWSNEPLGTIVLSEGLADRPWVVDPAHFSWVYAAERFLGGPQTDAAIAPPGEVWLVSPDESQRYTVARMKHLKTVDARSALAIHHVFPFPVPPGWKIDRRIHGNDGWGDTPAVWRFHRMRNVAQPGEPRAGLMDGAGAGLVERPHRGFVTASATHRPNWIRVLVNAEVAPAAGSETFNRFVLVLRDPDGNEHEMDRYALRRRGVQPGVVYATWTLTSLVPPGWSYGVRFGAQGTTATLLGTRLPFAVPAQPKDAVLEIPL